MTHDEMIEVIAAHRDGKKIQSGKKLALAETDFCDDNYPSWDFRNFDYRIKPEPLTLDQCWDKAMELTKTAGGVLEEFLKQAKENGHV